MPYPVLLNVNQTVVKPFGENVQAVEINNAGSNCWVKIDGNYVAGPYQQNVITLPAPESVSTCLLTSTAAPGQTNPANPQGIAILNFYPFQAAPGAATPAANPGVIIGGGGWGAGSPGNTLVQLTAGQSFTIDQINQYFNLLTGVMTGQLVTLANGVTMSGGQMTLQGVASNLLSIPSGGADINSATLETTVGRALNIPNATSASAINLPNGGMLASSFNATGTFQLNGHAMPNTFFTATNANFTKTGNVNFVLATIPNAGTWLLVGMIGAENVATDFGSSGVAIGNATTGNFAHGAMELPNTADTGGHAIVTNLTLVGIGAFTANQQYFMNQNGAAAAGNWAVTGGSGVFGLQLGN